MMLLVELTVAVYCTSCDACVRMCCNFGPKLSLALTVNSSVTCRERKVPTPASSLRTRPQDPLVA